MNHFRYIPLFAAILLMTACSSDSTLSEEDRVDTRVPMVFGTTSSSSGTTVTRTVTYLENNFKVNTWKNFGSTNQQVVMDGYEVDYSNSGSTHTWDYTKVTGQIQRYWDLSAFPYEFRAVTPYDVNGNTATIADDKITLNATGTPFKAQSYINGTKSTVTEPFLVSHVKRVKISTNYVDTDVIKNAEINNANGTADATRGVHMPFHHLVSKIGFRLFINDPQPTSPNYAVKLKNIKISVTNGIDNFVITSNKYEATNAQGLGKGTFSEITKATANDTLLLSHGEYTDVNFRNYLSKENAFDLCSGSSTAYDYLQQIPQGNIKIRVQLEMETDLVISGTVYKDNTFKFNQILSLDPTNTTGDVFTWDPDYRYIYYLHIPNLHGHVIYVNTCAILPWDEVQTTDIPIEL